MMIDTVPSGPIDTNAYLVSDSREAMAIDPSRDSTKKLLELAKKRGVKITMIIDTHGHWDHIADNYELQKATGAKILIHSKDEHYIQKPGSTLSLPFKIESTKADSYLEEGAVLGLGSLKFSILNTPGHTPGSCCLYEKPKGTIFTGDTLFAGAYGRTDFPGGDDKEMIKSLQRLASLPKETIVYPGHGPSTIIGKEDWLQKLRSL